MNIDGHRTTPHISIDQYVKNRQVVLGRSLDNRTSIYLDINFWIILRDVAAGTSADRGNVELLQLLRELVTAGRVFCPISESIFLELMKQSDSSSRLKCASLIDELSLGVTLIPHNTRMATELARFIHLSCHDDEDLHPLRHLVWTKLTNVLGVTHPAPSQLDAPAALAMQKSFFDHMWSIRLKSIVELVGDSLPSENDHFAGLAARLNDGASQHAAGLRSFAQAYIDELSGTIDACGDMIMEIVSDIAEKAAVTSPPAGSVEWKDAQRKWKNLIFLALKKGPTRQQLRSMHIAAALHAAFRWDKPRRLTGNDIYDFQHASAALAHCHAFFTEHALCSMITANHVALDRLYDCHVVTEVPGAIEYLKAVKGKPTN
jgi:hypothetical protein